MNTRIAAAASRVANFTGTGRAALLQDLSRLPMVAWAASGIDIVMLILAAMISRLGVTLGLAFVAFGFVAVWSTGLHPGRIAPRASEEIPYLIRHMTLAMVGFGLVAGQSVELGELFRLGVLAVALVLVARMVFYEHMRRLWARGVALSPVVLVGAGPTAANLATAMEEHPECGLLPIGFFDHNDALPLPLPYLGEVAKLPDIMREVGARHVVFGFGAIRESEMISIVRQSEPRLFFYVLLRFFELGVGRGHPAFCADIAGFPVGRIRPPAVGHPMLGIKRMIDLALALAGLMFLAPVMVGCAVAVRVTSRGPILFRQTRVGRDGATFEMLKFRTMEVNADSDTTWSVERDQRVTAVGRLLRASHLDELPQLVNVLCGDMSLVGPRPERPFFVEQFGEKISGYQDRHRVKAGITGWSQVNGLVGDSSIEERARHDNWYVEHWSPWMDILILLRTLPSMFSRRR